MRSVSKRKERSDHRSPRLPEHSSENSGEHPIHRKSLSLSYELLLNAMTKHGDQRNLEEKVLSWAHGSRLESVTGEQRYRGRNS